MAHKLVVNKQCRAVAERARQMPEQGSITALAASRSTAFAFGQRASRLGWTMVGCEKEGSEADSRSRRLDLLGKSEGFHPKERETGVETKSLPKHSQQLQRKAGMIWSYSPWQLRQEAVG